MIFHRTAITPLTLCLSPGVHFTAPCQPSQSSALKQEQSQHNQDREHNRRYLVSITHGGASPASCQLYPADLIAARTASVSNFTPSPLQRERTLGDHFKDLGA